MYKAKSKTKLNPQEAWNLVVEEACTTRAQEAPPSVISLLPKLSELGNIPRQKKKFVNFVKNSLRLHSDKVIDDLWEHLESGKEARARIVLRRAVLRKKFNRKIIIKRQR